MWERTGVSLRANGVFIDYSLYYVLLSPAFHQLWKGGEVSRLQVVTRRGRQWVVAYVAAVG